MLERLSDVARAANLAFYENVSKPAVGTAIDMTLGLGDLAQMGVRYLGNRMGMEAGVAALVYRRYPTRITSGDSRS
jgi:anti-sigma factor RsiW